MVERRGVDVDMNKGRIVDVRARWGGGRLVVKY